MIVRVGELRLEFDGMIEVGKRARQITQRLSNNAAIRICLGIAWIDGKSLIVVGQCSVEIPSLFAKARAVDSELREVRLQFDRGIEIYKRAAQIALEFPNYSAICQGFLI